MNNKHVTNGCIAYYEQRHTNLEYTVMNVMNDKHSGIATIYSIK